MPLLLLGLFLVSSAGLSSIVGQSSKAPLTQTGGVREWRFAVSGDSRNCGDIVMPAIAREVNGNQSQFYWHLGDFRAIYDFDEDMQRRPQTAPLTIIRYEQMAWDDFIQNQVAAFKVPVFLGIGNHETIPPKTRAEYLSQFADWLNTPVLKEQRLLDNPRDHRLKAYFHWVQNGVDFISFDNATPDQLDNEQMVWAEGVLARDEANPNIKAVVVGMHQALPDSIAAFHSMSDYPVGLESGRRLYARLLALRDRGHKQVYLLASHSHFFMDGIFNTEYLRAHGGVLPGWIIGTAGAVRYSLPQNAKDAKAAKTNVYGYLLATVNPAGEPEGTIRFEFREIHEADVPPEVLQQMGAELVHQCFEKNSQAKRE
ncbi:MAG: metallophosphoesterase family protein [Blastocatellia bacterium]